MQHNSNTKTILLTLGTTATNATASGQVDTKGFDSVRIAVFKSTTHAPTTFKIEHGDTTDATAFVACGLTGGTDYTIPIPRATVGIYSSLAPLARRLTSFQPPTLPDPQLVKRRWPMSRLPFGYGRPNGDRIAIANGRRSR